MKEKYFSMTWNVLFNTFNFILLQIVTLMNGAQNILVTFILLYPVNYQGKIMLFTHSQSKISGNISHSSNLMLKQTQKFLHIQSFLSNLITSPNISCYLKIWSHILLHSYNKLTSVAYFNSQYHVTYAYSCKFLYAPLNS